MSLLVSFMTNLFTSTEKSNGHACHAL